ncbi:DUF1937 family protein [Pseudomonas aeruginosa]
MVEQRFPCLQRGRGDHRPAPATWYSAEVSMSHPINLCLAELDRAAIGRLWGAGGRLLHGSPEELIVLDLPGWRDSAGIRREMEFFEAGGQRVSLWSEVEHEFR